MQMSEIEARVSQEIMDQVFEHFKINQQIFQESYKLAVLPENCEKFQMLQNALAQ